MAESFSVTEVRPRGGVRLSLRRMRRPPEVLMSFAGIALFEKEGRWELSR